MVTVKSTTAKGQALLRRAICYEGYYLEDVYGSFSVYKARAWRECLAMCEAEGGEDFRICSHCTSNFSVAWKVKGGWRMETRSNSYFIEFPKEQEA